MQKDYHTGKNNDSLEKLLSDPVINSIIDQNLDEELEDLVAFDDVQIDFESRDGEFNVSVSKDSMTVKADFISPIGSGKKMTMDECLKKLEKLGICKRSLDFLSLSEALHDSNDFGKSTKDVIIAKGQHAVPEIPDHINLLFNPRLYLRAINKLILDNKGNGVDYKGLSQICVLDKETPVAVQMKGNKGINGFDVFGKSIPFQKVITDKIKTGRNLYVDETGNVITRITGEFVLEDNEIYVNEVLTLSEGVNLHTGNIDYPGTVIIYGEVEDGFSINVQKNLFLYNSLAASMVKCDGNLVISNGGIIGRKNNSVEVKGFIDVDHTEAVTVKAEKYIAIKKGALNSVLYTNGKIYLGNRSKIIGGSINSKDGVVVTDIGSESGVDTYINCGVDYLDMEKILALKDYRLKLIDMKVSYMAIKSSPELMEIEKQILKCDLSLEKLLKKIQYNEKADIKVLGTVYPGTKIQICFVNLQVKERLHNVTFYLNKKDGEIHFKTN